jgi:hypothetical protein
MITLALHQSNSRTPALRYSRINSGKKRGARPAHWQKHIRDQLRSRDHDEEDIGLDLEDGLENEISTADILRYDDLGRRSTGPRPLRAVVEWFGT